MNRKRDTMTSKRKLKHYVNHNTLDGMLQEWPGASQFIIVIDTWFERLMAE